MAPTASSLKLNRRILWVVVALGVAAAVVLAGVAYYLDLHRYPSEDTPLILQYWGVSFIREPPDLDYDSAPPSFANISLSWSSEDSVFSYGSPLLSTARQLNISDFCLPDDLESYMALNITGWFSDDIIDGVSVFEPSGFFVTDYDGDGLFDYGDAVSLVTCVYEDGILTHQGYYPNIVYGFALEAYGNAGHYDPWEFKYAIHHGDLCAWACPYHIYFLSLGL